MSNIRYDIGEARSNSIVESKLLYISSAKYGGDWHSVPHAHPCTELFYVVGGTGGFQIENETFQVKAHDLIVINPNVLHTETSLNASPLEYVVLGVEGLELIHPGNLEDRFLLVNLKGSNESILSCMKIMLSEMEHKLPGADSVCQNILQALIIQVLRVVNASPEHTVRASRRECATAKWYIDKHFKEKITLDSLAEFCGKNKYHLTHCFTEEYGMPPIKYLNQKRIEESKYLLSSTDLPLGRIVQTLSFSSPSYFAQMFRNAEGMTPSEYRERCRSR